jgi:ribosomal protein L1
MARLTKKVKAQQGKVDSNKLYAIDSALAIVKECATAKFDESIDVAVQLGVDAKKSDQVVRGAVVLPNGTGKTKRVAVFAQGAKAEEAKAATWSAWKTWRPKSRPAISTSTSSSHRPTRCASSARWARSSARAA